MSRTERIVEENLPPEQALLFSALRSEFDAKLGSLRAWGIAALIGGQVVAGLVTAYVGPSNAAHAAMSAAHYFV